VQVPQRLPDSLRYLGQLPGGFRRWSLGLVQPPVPVVQPLLGETLTLILELESRLFPFLLLQGFPVILAPFLHRPALRHRDLRINAGDNRRGRRGALDTDARLRREL